MTNQTITFLEIIYNLEKKRILIIFDRVKTFWNNDYILAKFSIFADSHVAIFTGIRWWRTGHSCPNKKIGSIPIRIRYKKSRTNWLGSDKYPTCFQVENTPGFGVGELSHSRLGNISKPNRNYIGTESKSSRNRIKNKLYFSFFLKKKSLFSRLFAKSKLNY